MLEIISCTVPLSSISFKKGKLSNIANVFQLAPFNLLIFTQYFLNRNIQSRHSAVHPKHISSIVYVMNHWTVLEQ